MTFFDGVFAKNRLKTKRTSITRWKHPHAEMSVVILLPNLKPKEPRLRDGNMPSEMSAKSLSADLKPKEPRLRDGNSGIWVFAKNTVGS